MQNFRGLEKFGLESLCEIEIFEETPKQDLPSDNGNKGAKRRKMMTEEEALFDKSYKCVCCGADFKTKAVRAGRTKLERVENDLRPIYYYFDSLKYETVVCPHCGYAGLIKNFSYLSDSQIKLIKEKISCRFKGLEHKGSTYSYDEAIERAQLALLSSIVKGAKNGEKAYTCLKIAWLLRGKRESLDVNMPNYEEEKVHLLEQEIHNLKNAYQGFTAAYSNENFPIAGMDEPTLCLILAETARKLHKKEEAMKFLGKVILSKTASERLKDIARSVKEECAIMEE